MNTSTPWVSFGADPRASAIPWLTEEESKSGVLYVATEHHKQIFFDLAACANESERAKNP